MNWKFLCFDDEEIERKYYEDEYLRIICVLTYEIYLGTLICVLLVIMGFVESDYPLYIGSAAAVILLPFIILTLAKKYPYECNWIISGNNIAWCMLVCVAYFWTKSNSEDICSGDCSYLFAVGGCFYTVHLALLIGTNFSLNVLTFVIINAVYTFTLMPPIPNLVCLIILAPMCFGVTHYLREKNTRLYYELINKYYIWYHIANNVLPEKFIVTKSAESHLGYQLVKANRRARKEYSLNSTEDLEEFISTIDLKQETMQVVNNYEDTLGFPGVLDSQASKSIGAISEFSKKSYTSRISHAKTSANPIQPRLVPLDLIIRREIRRENSTDLENPVAGDLPSSHGAGTLHENQEGEHLLSGAAGENGTIFNNNVNTETLDGAMHMRNKKRSLFEIDDPELQSIDNQKERRERKSNAVKMKVEKYKGVFKSDPEEKRKFLLTLVCYSKDEQFELIMIEEDSDGQREQVLEEEASLYESFSINFANIVLNDSNTLQFYLQEIKLEGQEVQKKVNDYIIDLFQVNANLMSRVHTFTEFFNIESNKIELAPKQFSLKKMIREIYSEVELRVKQNGSQVILSNECPAEMDILFNDEKRIRYILTYLLEDCIQNTEKGQIVISSSSGGVEIGDGGDKALHNTIKIMIRDNSARKYVTQRNNDYIFQSTNLSKITKNKTRSFEDIEMSVCKEILKRIGPQSQIFYLSDERNTNRVSFYIYTDILSEAGNIDMSHTKILQDDKDENDHAVHELDDDDDQGFEFHAEIENSDEDEETFNNNNEQLQGANSNSAAEDLQGSGGNNHLTGTSAGGGGGHEKSFEQVPELEEEGSSSDKFGLQQSHLIEQLQGGIQGAIEAIQLEPQSENNSMSAIFSSQTGLQQQSNTQSSVLNFESDKLVLTQPDRPSQPFEEDLTRREEMRKSASQLFEESDKINEENPVSEIYLKELSQESVRFKRDLTRKMSSIPNMLFKSSVEDLDHNGRLSFMNHGNSNNSSNNNFVTEKPPSTFNSFSKSLVNNTILILSVVTTALMS